MDSFESGHPLWVYHCVTEAEYEHCLEPNLICRIFTAKRVEYSCHINSAYVIVWTENITDIETLRKRVINYLLLWLRTAYWPPSLELDCIQKEHLKEILIK